MPAHPLRRFSRGALARLLILLLLLEAGLGGGLYVSAKSSSSSTVVHVTTPKPLVCKEHGVQNSPKTVVVGHAETFSVCLHNLPNVVLTYTLSYSDGTSKVTRVQSDSTGYSKQSFIIKYQPQSPRDPVGISISYAGAVQQFTRFAVQLPNYKGR